MYCVLIEQKTTQRTRKDDDQNDISPVPSICKDLKVCVMPQS